MSELTERVTEILRAHEALAPEPAQVLANAASRVRRARRRRLAVRASGVSVLGAGLAVGATTAPSWWHPAGTSRTLVVSPAAGGQSNASADPSPSPQAHNQQAEFDAYFSAGYDYTSAQQLAKLWNMTDLAQVKTKAGGELLDGQPLPVTPPGPPETEQQRAEDAFFSYGYDYQDAVQLGSLWQQGNITTIKAEAGQKLLDGQSLPIQPSGGSDESGGQAASLQAYFAGGYDYNDAVKLARLWRSDNIGQIKVRAGEKLLHGQSLPIQP